MAKHNFRFLGFIVLVLLGPGVSYAGELDIPNRFTANTRALAAEVNANFDAVETAVDGNAADIAELRAAAPGAGILVRVDGELAGRFMAAGGPFIRVFAVDGTSIVRVPEFATVGTAPVLNLLSVNGYRFSIMAGDFDHPFLDEGQVNDLVLFYDDGACMGSVYFPVEGDTGFFSRFEFGVGMGRPAKRWAMRQGVVVASPDPTDATPVYMVRRNTAVTTVALGSFKFYNSEQAQAVCVPMTVFAEYDPNDPLDVNHTAVALEANDTAESGVPNSLGGPITLDY